MKYGIVKLMEKGLTAYNMNIFEEGEDIIAFPLEEFQTEMLRLKYYLEKSGDKAKGICKGKIRYKKQGISKIGDELSSAKKTMNSLMQFKVQTSLNDFEWPEVEVRKKKRISINKPLVPSLVDRGEVKV